jgi:hypothetical protein
MVRCGRDDNIIRRMRFVYGINRAIIQQQTVKIVNSLFFHSKSGEPFNAKRLIKTLRIETFKN